MSWRGRKDAVPDASMVERMRSRAARSAVQQELKTLGKKKTEWQMGLNER
jgi:hypothetical protein